MAETERKQTGENELIREFITLFATTGEMVLFQTVLRHVREIYDADRVYVVDFSDPDDAIPGEFLYSCAGECMLGNSLKGIDLQVLKRIFKHYGGYDFYIDDLKKTADDFETAEYEFFQSNFENIVSFMAVPFINDGTICGAIGIDNPKANCDKRTLLSVIAAQFFTELVRRRAIGKLSAEKEKDRIREKLYYKNLHRLTKSGAFGFYYNCEGNMTRVEWSDEFRHMLGFENEAEFPNTFDAWEERIYLDDWSPEICTMKRLDFAAKDDGFYGKADSQTYEAEYRLRTKDNEYRWFNCKASITPAAEPDYLCFGGVFTDITEQKEHEELEHLRQEALYDADAEIEKGRENLKELAEIIEEAGVGVWRIEYPEEGKPRMEGDSKLHEILAIPADMTDPTEIYNYWAGRVKRSSEHSVEENIEKIKREGFAENTYVWRHPVLGEQIMRSGGNCSYVEGKGYILRGHHSNVSESYFDKLTGLLNRRAYSEELEDRGWNTDKDCCAIVVDVNGLKIVNDRGGHEAGDELISGVASCLKEVFADGNVYRTGGDEFCILMNADNDKADLLLDEFGKKVRAWRGRLVDKMSVSYGKCIRGEKSEMNLQDIIKYADNAMYEMKNAYYSRHPELKREAIQKRTNLELRALIDRFTISYDFVGMIDLENNSCRIIKANTETAHISRKDTPYDEMADLLVRDIVKNDGAEKIYSRVALDKLKKNFEKKDSLNIYFLVKDGTWRQGTFSILQRKHGKAERAVFYTKHISRMLTSSIENQLKDEMGSEIISGLCAGYSIVGIVDFVSEKISVYKYSDFPEAVANAIETHTYTQALEWYAEKYVAESCVKKMVKSADIAAVREKVVSKGYYEVYFIEKKNFRETGDETYGKFMYKEIPAKPEHIIFLTKQVTAEEFYNHH